MTAPRWFEDNALSIGRTPLVRLNRVSIASRALWDLSGLVGPLREARGSRDGQVRTETFDEGAGI